MAGLRATYSVADSLMTFLRNSFPDPLRHDFACEFRAISAGELADESAPVQNALTLYLYRITMNEHMRNVRTVNGASDARPPLSIDLHYLLTVWNDSALAEHTIMTWAMRQLHEHPVLDASALSSAGEWDPADIVHIVPSELSTEEVFRIWDTLAPDYRLSMPYTARVVRIDNQDDITARPVAATRLGFSEKGR